MYLQEVIKNSLTQFNDERCFENNFKNKPWER